MSRLPRFTLRELVLIGVFGALWGVVETTVGSLMHLAHVPFKGALLGGFGLLVVLIGRLFVPRRGATLSMGIVTAILKMFSLGEFVFNPMLAIFMEALLAELVLSGFGQPSRRSFMLAGAAGTGWNFLHPLVTWGILGGQGIVTLWTDTINNGAYLLGISPDAAWLVAALLIVIYAGSGLIGGWLAWGIGRRIQARQAASLNQAATP
ncbi:MAG: ECF transporter S component [Anaerolineae bacterium]|nr:ECF transporter S component [Anaerolineae bacterium]